MVGEASLVQGSEPPAKLNDIDHHHAPCYRSLIPYGP